MKTIVRMAIVMAMTSVYAAAQGPAPPEVTEHHKQLHKEVGVWDGEMKMWMAPGQDPMVMPVVETNTLMDGDLWLISEFESGPFQGRGQFGYDTINEKFVGSWIDNMSTTQSVMKGEMNDQGEMVMYSTGYNRETNAPEKTKSVTKFVGDDAKEFLMYTKGEGDDEWNKTFEITYKRRKS